MHCIWVAWDISGILALDIQTDEFEQKYFIYDNERKPHISESENGYLWISTMGLVSKGKLTDNKYVNACGFQYVTLSLLIDKAINLCLDETIYDIDSINYEYLCKLTPAFFHNMLFYFETFGKAYLAINNVSFPNSHKLSEILSKVRQTMFDLHHNDTLFHSLIISIFKELVEHIGKIPGSFKEQYVKYDDNSGDSTVFSFSQNKLEWLRNTLETSYDFIISYYHCKEDNFYLNQGLFNRMLDMAKNDEDKQRITETHGFLNESR